MRGTQAITLRLPGDLYEQLRREAFDTRDSMNRLIIEALRYKLTPEKFGQLCNLFEAAWHHVVPESLDDLPPMTSPDARKLAAFAAEVLTS